MEAPCRVLRSVRLTPTTHAVHLERPAAFRFRPGQHVAFVLGSGEDTDDRFLSIASAPEAPELVFAVRLSASAFKRRLAALREGDMVRILGPAGRFVLDPQRPAVFLSGGIGITPLRSMLQHIVLAGHTAPAVLIYGNRSPDEIPFRAELAAWADARDNVRVVHVVDEPDASWDGPTGRIGPDLVRAQADALDEPIFYVCGPPGMVGAMQRLLDGLGIPGDRIRIENFTGY